MSISVVKIKGYEMLEKIKRLIPKLKEKEEKLNKLLAIFDDIKITDDSVVIKFNKNIACYSEGHQLFVSKNDILIKSKYLHLNPKISAINDVKNGKTNKVINYAHKEKDKMLGIVKETLEYDKEVIKEEEEEGNCHNCT